MKNRRIHQGQLIGTGEKVFNAGMAILGIVISLVVLYPIYYVLIASLSQPYYVENGDVMFAIRHFTLASYKEAIKKSGIWLAYGNTIFYTVAGVVVNMLFTTTMAYALSKKKLVFRKFFTLFTIFTMWFNAFMKFLFKVIFYYNTLSHSTWNFMHCYVYNFTRN